ncbi:hypothetical protein QOZ99_002051 [Angulomicrobium amanitiforme]|uniref:DUF2628 domain-containing protein n=1 Tax=Ancylobacter amanitiformis TaxID=217069 RepID=A0ABU0LR76_9HYPH|nr:hypothetical protein [Ancylobacter amanitiformis]
MTVWTVFEPDGADETANTLAWADGVVLVPEKLSWSAILLAPLVLLVHRLWLALIGYVLLQGLIGFAASQLELERGVPLLALLVNIAVAIALPSLRRSSLGWRGFEEAGAVAAPTLEAAEQRYFEARLGGAGLRPLARSPGSPLAVTPVPRPTAGPVLGLFPEAGR